MYYGDRMKNLLAQLDDDELEAIWTSHLKLKVSEESFDRAEKQQRVVLVSREWRSAHGHTVMNVLRRGRELPWRRILIDVADKLKPGVGWTKYRMSGRCRDEVIERQILRFFDERVKKKWESMSEEKRQEFARDLNTRLKNTTEIAAALKDKTALHAITVSLLDSGISAGLIVGGGALMIAQATLPGAIASVFAGLLAQIGFTVVVSLLGWMAGVKIALSGGAATLGGVIIGLPVLLVAITHSIMSTSYRKTIPATLAVLTSIELRKQFGGV